MRNLILDLWCGLGSTLTRVVFRLWVNFKEIDYDYSKYLGKDWRQDLNNRTKKAACVVTNHVQFIDWILFVSRYYSCTFVMRSDFGKVPIMGTATKTMQCFEVKRGANKEENN